MIEPFEISVPESTIADLHARLRAARWPAGVGNTGGVPREEMQEVVRHWLEDFDWNFHQFAMNCLPQFRVKIRGQRLHFFHLPAKSPHAIPLLLLHGWPGSFVEMLGAAAILGLDFHVVVPSLPGYGFSDPPTSPGMSNARMAGLFVKLMSALGYEKFGVQGGDWGAGIATWLAVKFPERLLGIHLNYIPGSYAPTVKGPLAPEEQAFLDEKAAWFRDQGAYGHVQSTRPLTLAYGLSDSPVGLAAWIYEKFREWADPRSALLLDFILSNVMIYWVTNTIGSSVRLYLESMRTPLRFASGKRVTVPCGIAHFPCEAPFPPRAWVERVYDVKRWTEMPRGGHFAAFEEPELLAEEVKSFFLEESQSQAFVKR